MAFGDADLGVFTADFGVTVEFGGTSALANLDQPQKMFLGDHGYAGVDVAVPAIRLPFNAFSPMPEEEDTLTVDGADYVVGCVEAEGDGGFVRIDLKAAS
ncbi:MAG TPA: hypothetical protein VGF88_23605 [Acidobacteriaceae bacterium]|jgi:hypothetical protein